MLCCSLHLTSRCFFERFRALIAVLFGNLWLAAMCALSLLAVWCFWCGASSRLSFSAANLGVACRALKATPSTPAVVSFTMLFSGGWGLLWILALAGLAELMSGVDLNDSGSVGIITTFLLLLSFFWGGNVISNVGHVAVSGAVASWWFKHPSNFVLESSSVTSNALWRACTSSFGSVCYGSLLVSLLEAARSTLRSLRKLNRCVAFCVDCVLSVLEGWTMYINRYAFTYVAIYGDDFMTAGRRVNALFNHRGFWNTIVNDVILSRILYFGALGIALSSAAFGYAIGYLLLKHDDHASAIALVGLLIGWLLATATMGAVDSAVATVYVAFGEDPQALKDNHPDDFGTLYKGWNQNYPEVMAVLLVAA